MKINFQYNKERDVWCLLNKGKSSNNSQNPTGQYKQLVQAYGENPTEESASLFVDKYIEDNKLVIDEYIKQYQTEWDLVAGEYHKRAEAIFGVSLSANVDVYLTINSRCPYHIKENSFYVAFPRKSANSTVMHELWHFYTWYGCGTDQEQVLGKQKYNDIKESLTVLLNVECKDLFPENIFDAGYPQHKEMREKILEYWAKDRNIINLWKFLILNL